MKKDNSFFSYRPERSDPDDIKLKLPAGISISRECSLSLLSAQGGVQK